MPTFTRRVFLAAAGLAFTLPAWGRDGGSFGTPTSLQSLADDKDKPRVEFRKAEKDPADGLTEAVVLGTDHKVYLHRKAELTGADVASAKVGVDPNTADPTIEVELTEAGAKKIAKLSEDHAEKPLAVVVDGKVISAPVIKAKLGAKIVVTGKFTKDEAERIAKAMAAK